MLVVKNTMWRSILNVDQLELQPPFLFQDPIPLTSTTTTQNLARLDKMVKFEVEGVKEKRKEKQPSLIRSYSV